MSEKVTISLTDEQVESLAHQIFDLGKDAGLTPEELAIALGIIKDWMHDELGIINVTMENDNETDMGLQ